MFLHLNLAQAGASNGYACKDTLRVESGSRIKPEFHRVAVTSDAGLIVYREFDEALGLMKMGEIFGDSHRALPACDTRGLHPMRGRDRPEPARPSAVWRMIDTGLLLFMNMGASSGPPFMNLRNTFWFWGPKYRARSRLMYAFL